MQQYLIVQSLASVKNGMTAIHVIGYELVACSTQCCMGGESSLALSLSSAEKVGLRYLGHLRKDNDRLRLSSDIDKVNPLYFVTKPLFRSSS